MIEREEEQFNETSSLKGFMGNVDFGGDLPVVQGNRCGSLNLPVSQDSSPIAGVIQ